MIATIIIALLAVGILFLIAMLVMAKRENDQLQEDLSATVPFRKSQYATPFVPKPWQLTEEQLREIESRDTRTPSDPAS